MSESPKTAFTSLSDMREKFVDMFSGPTFSSTFAGLDKRLRKKIMITVSIANNCTE
jgi:hypothetical protein